MKSLFASLMALTAILGGSAIAGAEDKPLRFKYEKGDKEKYEMTVDQDISFDLMGMKIEVKMDMGMEGKRTVTGVDRDGNFETKDKFSRMKMKMAMLGMNFEVDSDKKADDDENELLKPVGEMIRGLAGLEVEAKMTTRGEVKDTKMDKKALEKLKEKLPPGLGDQFNPEDLANQTNMAMLVLPEKFPKIDEEWKHKTETSSNGAKMVMDITYTYLGTTKVDGKELHKIGMKMKMDAKADDGAQVKMKFKKQKSDGVCYFDAANGRFVKMEHKMEADIEMSAMGLDLSGTMTMKMTYKASKD